jgi:hypothetical protein
MNRIKFWSKIFAVKGDVYRAEPGYNDISLYNTSYITSHILWYQLIPHS